MIRVFSNNNDTSYNNYLKNIKGKTILTNLKTKPKDNNSNHIIKKNNKLVYYLSYNDFLNVTQTFYRYTNLNKTYKAPQKIIDLRTSFIFYTKILDHLQKCNLCKGNNIEFCFNKCIEIKNILYPFGEYFTYEIYSNLATVDVNDWCSYNKCSNTPSDTLFVEPSLNNTSASYDKNTRFDKRNYSNKRVSFNESIDSDESVSSDESVFSDEGVSSDESVFSDENVIYTHKNDKQKSNLIYLHGNNKNNFVQHSEDSEYNEDNTITPNNQLNETIKSNNSLLNKTSIFSSQVIETVNSNNNQLNKSFKNSEIETINKLNNTANNRETPLQLANNRENNGENNGENNRENNGENNRENNRENNGEFMTMNGTNINYNSKINISNNNIEDMNDILDIEDIENIEDNIKKSSLKSINLSSALPNKTIYNIFIAEITNNRIYSEQKNEYIDLETENKYYNTYNFVPINVTFHEFKNMFFNSNSNYFNITDTPLDPLKLSNQYFINIHNNPEKFILANAIKKIYTISNNYKNMDANILIGIEKEVLNITSLYDFPFITNSLSLDDILYNIHENNINANDYVLQMKLKVYYKSLLTDIPLIITYKYLIEKF